MEAQPTLVRADGTIEFDTVTAIDLNIALVVNPWHAEYDDAFGFDDAFENPGTLVLGVLVDARLKGFEHFPDRLLELRLMGVGFADQFENAGNV